MVLLGILPMVAMALLVAVDHLLHLAEPQVVASMQIITTTPFTHTNGTAQMVVVGVEAWGYLVQAQAERLSLALGMAGRVGLAAQTEALEDQTTNALLATEVLVGFMEEVEVRGGKRLASTTMVLGGLFIAMAVSPMPQVASALSVSSGVLAVAIRRTPQTSN